jgi:hypothetical protein
MAMTTFSYVSTVLTQVNITKPCLIGGLSTGNEVPLAFLFNRLLLAGLVVLYPVQLRTRPYLITPQPVRACNRTSAQVATLLHPELRRLFPPNSRSPVPRKIRHTPSETPTQSASCPGLRFSRHAKASTIRSSIFWCLSKRKDTDSKAAHYPKKAKRPEKQRVVLGVNSV